MANQVKTPEPEQPAMYWRMGERILRTERGQVIQGYNIEKKDFGIIGQWVDEAGMGDDFIDKIVNGLNGIDAVYEGSPPFNMSRQRLISFVIRMQNILYFEDGRCNPDKQWDSDTLEQIQRAIADFGLIPNFPQYR